MYKATNRKSAFKIIFLDLIVAFIYSEGFEKYCEHSQLVSRSGVSPFLKSLGKGEQSLSRMLSGRDGSKNGLSNFKRGPYYAKVL